ncbi:28S ribosomal protein S34, mitochondrial [Rana temporaria]|uniref:28S ribosomal protein S34, mitochondrial n=1 Tax=Rana temporaria TaxID=8407 RepID=UPI001AAD7453|nr:28S ribosomal protein S34, mitochondrial [Rana temporaria]
MGREKRVRNIAEMARKIREYRALKNRPTESQRYAMDYENLTRPFTGKRMPVLAWEDIKNEKRLFSLLPGLRSFGIGRMVTKKSWLEDFDEPCYWTITKVKVDYTAENMDHGQAWGYLTYRGKTVSEEKEISKVMYHDWRLIPRHEEETFKNFIPVPEPEPIRYVRYPPLLRAMFLAQLQKEGKPLTEPMLDIGRLRESDQELKNELRVRRAKTGTPV